MCGNLLLLSYPLIDNILGGFEKLVRQTSALDKILGGFEKLVRQTFALDQNLGGGEKLLRRIFALYEKFRRMEQVKEKMKNKNNKK